MKEYRVIEYGYKPTDIFTVWWFVDDQPDEEIYWPGRYSDYGYVVFHWDLIMYISTEENERLLF